MLIQVYPPLTSRINRFGITMERVVQSLETIIWDVELTLLASIMHSASICMLIEDRSFQLPRALETAKRARNNEIPRA